MKDVLLKYFSILSTREWATIFWLLILLICILKNTKTRKSFFEVIKILFGKVLIKIWIIISLYVLLITLIFYKTPIWSNYYIKDIIIWFITSGAIYCFNAASSESNEQYIGKVLKENLKLTIIIEFFYSTFTFSLWTELLLIPSITFLILLDTYAETKKEYTVVHKLMQVLLFIIGIWLFYETFKLCLSEYKKLDILNTFISFMIPIVYMILIIPLEYMIELYSKYEILFIRMSFKKNNDKKIARNQKFLIIRECNLSIQNVILFQKNYCSRMYAKMPESEFMAIINEFKKAKKNQKNNSY